MRLVCHRDLRGLSSVILCFQQPQMMGLPQLLSPLLLAAPTAYEPTALCHSNAPVQYALAQHPSALRDVSHLHYHPLAIPASAESTPSERESKELLAEVCAPPWMLCMLCLVSITGRRPHALRLFLGMFVGAGSFCIKCMTMCTSVHQAARPASPLKSPPTLSSSLPSFPGSQGALSPLR